MTKNTETHESLIAVSLFLLSFGLMETIVAGCLIWYWREESIIKFAQKPFLFIMLLGILIGFASTLMFITWHASREMCSTCVFLLYASVNITAGYVMIDVC